MTGDLFRNHARIPSVRSEFLRITRSRYENMVKRLGERRSQSGRVTRVARELPFTLAEYRIWCRAQLGGPTGIARCEYCDWPVDLHTMQTEHRTPLAQGGSLELANLCVACKACNDQKGKMRAQAFVHLLSLVNNTAVFNEMDKTDCLGRLQMALKLAIESRYKASGATATQAPKETVMPHVREPRRLA